MTSIFFKLSGKSAVVVQSGETVEFRDGMKAKHTLDLENFGTAAGDSFTFDREALILGMGFYLPSNAWGSPTVQQIYSVRTPEPRKQLKGSIPSYLLDPNHRLHQDYRKVIRRVPGIVKRHFLDGLRHGLLYPGEFLVASDEPDYGWILSPRNHQLLDAKLKARKYAK